MQVWAMMPARTQGVLEHWSKSGALSYPLGHMSFLPRFRAATLAGPDTGHSKVLQYTT